MIGLAGFGAAHARRFYLVSHNARDRAGAALGLRLTVNKLTQLVVPIASGSLSAVAGMRPVF